VAQTISTEREHLAVPHGAELTPEALVAGAAVAAIMGASYPYMVLKLGFGPNVSVVSAFFGFILLSLIARKRYDRWRNNIVQTAGTSAAQTAFMCSVLAAFDMLRASHVVRFTLDPTPLQVFVWLSTASLLGVLLSAPMRRHFVVDEQLPFPDGMAAGETLMVLDPRHGEAAQSEEGRRHARRAAMVLGVGLALSGLVMLVRSDARLFDLIPDTITPGALMLGAGGAAFSLAVMGVGASVSLLSIGSGLLIGFRINAAMLIGCVLGWIVAPYLLVAHGLLANHPSRTQVLYWIMWPGLGMMMAGGLTALIVRWRMLAQAFAGLARAGSGADEFPLAWVGVGVAVLTAALCVIQRAFFGLPVWMSLVAIALSAPLMLVGLRALGETNWGPIGPLSNLMQGLFALIAPGNALANVMGNGTTGTIAVTSEGLMQDYRAGQMIGSTPRSMTIAQLMGAPIGAAALALTYPALVKTYGIVGEHAQLAAPGSRRTAALAELLSGGIDKLSHSALIAGAIAAALGVVFAILETRPSLRRWTPSPTGLGLGVLLPFASVATIFLGGVAAVIWQARHPATAERYRIPLASGLIAGEAIVAVIVPVLLALGLGRG
jgi:uncharacterized oligopeptide transporter (OPT) family protein